MAVSLVGRTATGESEMVNHNSRPLTWLLEFALASVCDPSYFGRKALDMALLLLKVVAGDEDGVVAVPDTNRLDLLVKVIAYLLPTDRQNTTRRVIALTKQI
jgi:hypothetical protein